MSERTNIPLVKWMESEGMADDYLLHFDWSKFGNDTTQEEVDRIEAPTAKFFLAHTKAELFAGAVRTNTQVYPVSTQADMLADTQLAARQFWVEVEHPELRDPDHLSRRVCQYHRGAAEHQPACPVDRRTQPGGLRGELHLKDHLVA